MSKHFEYRPGRGEIVLLGRVFRVPQARWLRIVLGSVLVVLGIFGFLPVLGFWMIPLGLLILSQDLPSVRRWRRKIAVRFGRREPRDNGDAQ